MRFTAKMGVLRTIIVIGLCVLVPGILNDVYGQNTTDWDHVDSVVAHYPNRPLRVKAVSNRINRDFLKPEERARAIFYWISTHLAYDVRTNRKRRYSYKNDRQLDRINNRIALRAFRKQKGVCEGYSRLYKKMAEQCGLECKVVSGEAKTEEFDIGNQRFQATHAWNAVKINGEWKLLDATWGAGGTKKVDRQGKRGKKKVFVPRFKDVYFFTQPEVFFLKHFPSDTSMLLCKRTYEEFSNLPLCKSRMLELGIMLSDSTKGVIWGDEGDTISIQLNTQYELKDLEFKFSREKWDHMATQAYATESGYTFEFVNPYINGGYLWVYWRNESLAAFRIRPKPEL